MPKLKQKLKLIPVTHTVDTGYSLDKLTKIACLPWADLDHVLGNQNPTGGSSFILRNYHGQDEASNSLHSSTSLLNL